MMGMRKMLMGVLFLIGSTGCPPELDCTSPHRVINPGGSNSWAQNLCDSEAAWTESTLSMLTLTLPWFLTQNHTTAELRLTADAHAPSGEYMLPYAYTGPDGSFGSGAIGVEIRLKPGHHDLAVAIDGDGSVSNETIECGKGLSKCAASYSESESVTLDIEPEPGWELGGIDNCGSMQLNQAKMVGNLSEDIRECRISFVRQSDKRLLGLAIAGGGGEVLVESAEGTDTCTDSCSMAFEIGTAVTLTAQDVGGFTFERWTGDCASNGSRATITMLRDAQCTAEFKPPNSSTYTLTVDVTGPGFVSVPNMQQCAADSSCDYSISANSSVQLTAHPDVEHDAVIAHWGGACGSGNATMVGVTMDASKTCSVVFESTHVDCTSPTSPTAGKIVLYNSSGDQITTMTTDDRAPEGATVYQVHHADGVLRAVPMDFASNVGGSLVYGWDDSFHSTAPPNVDTIGPEISISTATFFENYLYGVYVEATDACGLTTHAEVYFLFFQN